MFASAAAGARTCVRIFYAVAGVCWLAALIFAGVRLYQIFTQTLVPAEVLRAGLRERWDASTDSEGNYESALSYDREAEVRYTVDGKAFTGEIRQSGSGFRWLEEIAILEWKPGARIRVRIDPARPEKPMPRLGLRYSTFDFTFAMLFAGCLFAAFGFGMARAMSFMLGKLRV